MMGAVAARRCVVGRLVSGFCVDCTGTPRHVSLAPFLPEEVITLPEGSLFFDGSDVTAKCSAELDRASHSSSLSSMYQTFCLTPSIC